MSRLCAQITGIGFWANALPSWQAARAFVATGALTSVTAAETAAETAARPQPRLLPPNERRRAPESVAVALEVALAACNDAGADPAQLPSVFASTHGDLAITDYMCATLAQDPAALSPIRFHNSVHNAAAGYWTIGNACTAATTAISAFDASFALGLVEALSQLDAGADAVLLAGYDSSATGPAATLWASHGLLGGALVLARAGAGPRLEAHLADGEAAPGTGALSIHAAGNAMAPMLPLFDALAVHAPTAILHAGPGRVLRIGLTMQGQPTR